MAGGLRARVPCPRGGKESGREKLGIFAEFSLERGRAGGQNGGGSTAWCRRAETKENSR